MESADGVELGPKFCLELAACGLDQHDTPKGLLLVVLTPVHIERPRLASVANRNDWFKVANLDVRSANAAKLAGNDVASSSFTKGSSPAAPQRMPHGQQDQPAEILQSSFRHHR